VLVLLALAGALTALWLGSLTLGEDAVTVLNLTVAGIVGPLFALYVGLNRYAPSAPTVPALRLGRPRGQTVWAVIVASVIGLALALLLTELTRRLLVRWPLPKLTVEQESELQLLHVPHPLLLSLLFILVGVAEETLFRGLIQPRLTQTIGAVRAVLVTLALSLIAFDLLPQFLPTSVILSGVCGLVALATASTWVPIAMRTAYFLAPHVLPMLGLAWSDFDGAKAGLLSTGGAIACGMVAVGGLALIWRIRAPKENA
jgi:membrane protease YdiL (CAAX protease family)